MEYIISISLLYMVTFRAPDLVVIDSRSKALVCYSCIYFTLGVWNERLIPCNLCPPPSSDRLTCYFHRDCVIWHQIACCLEHAVGFGRFFMHGSYPQNTVC